MSFHVHWELQRAGPTQPFHFALSLTYRTPVFPAIAVRCVFCKLRRTSRKIVNQDLEFCSSSICWNMDHSDWWDSNSFAWPCSDRSALQAPLRLMQSDSPTEFGHAVPLSFRYHGKCQPIAFELHERVVFTGSSPKEIPPGQLVKIERLPGSWSFKKQLG